MKLGLDELIIVNPGSPPSATSWFLGADGGIYQLARSTASQRSERQLNGTFGDAGPVPKYFLGDDGILYETR